MNEWINKCFRILSNYYMQFITYTILYNIIYIKFWKKKRLSQCSGDKSQGHVQNEDKN